MIILGLTGSIGMGKSTASAMLRRLRLPVFDSDAVVHRLQAPGGAALPAIDTAFPGVVGPAGMDRARLGALVFGDPAARRRLERIVHPLVHAERQRFLRIQALRRQPLVVFDIPLLFEGGGERSCDAVAVVSAPAAIQRRRVMARPGMTADKFAGIVRTQVPDRVKRRKADFILPTGRGKAVTLAAIRRMLAALAGRRSRCWPPGSPGQKRRR